MDAETVVVDAETLVVDAETLVADAETLVVDGETVVADVEKSVEIVLEPLEDVALGLSVTFKVVALLHALQSFLLITVKSFRYINADVDY